MNCMLFLALLERCAFVQGLKYIGFTQAMGSAFRRWPVKQLQISCRFDCISRILNAQFFADVMGMSLGNWQLVL